MPNLNQLFAGAPQKPSTTLKLNNGKITLFKRPESAQWQCRFRAPNGRWCSYSTNTVDVDEAQEKALDIYMQTKLRIESGIAHLQKNFKQVAQEEIQIRWGAQKTEREKRNINDHQFILDKYLIPFFGKVPVSEITQQIMSDFDSWRISEMGRIPKSSTQRHHASAFNRVIKFARHKNYIPIHKIVVDMKVRGEKGQPRPAFSNEELEQMYAFMPTWCEDVYHKRSNQVRVLCCAYIKILVNTGIRHSTESLPLRWRHLQWHWIGDKKYLRIWVSGKTGPRYLIAKHSVVEVLTELMQWQRLPYATLDDLIEAKLDKAIFRTPDGELSSLMENIFRHLMIKSGLLKDSSGQTRTLYSLRHTYATQSLENGVDIHTLARQMGTSVLMIERHYSKITPMMNAEKLA